MELLKNIIIDFCLFSLIEGYICCLFFEKIGKLKHFKWYEILILSFGNCLISQFFPPIIYQIIMILWMGFYIIIKNNSLIIFKFSIYIVMLILIVEMNSCLLYELLLKIDFSNLNNIKLFVINIPLKLIEIIIIKIIERRMNKMKMWAGEVVR